MTRKVAFVGPLPPPLNGFSHICGLMLQRFRERTTVDVFDRAPHPRGGAYTMFAQGCRLLEYGASCLRPGHAVLYLALSGGQGQLIDLLYVLISKLFRRSIIIHHHSFSYIHSSSLLNKCFFAVARDAAHIVLTQGMGIALTRRYDLDTTHVQVVSNAAFFRCAEKQPGGGAAGQGMNIGYLSNITFEKGFVEFFEILQTLSQQGVRFTAKVAGPIDAAAQERFESLLAASSQTQYVGALYGEAKEAFYRQLDVFVFPTRYTNEAEPLVLYEAMSAAVYVVACDRGGIREMVGDAGLVAAEESIVARAAERIRQLSQNPAELICLQAASLRRAQRVSAEAALALNDFLDRTVASADA